MPPPSITSNAFSGDDGRSGYPSDQLVRNIRVGLLRCGYFRQGKELFPQPPRDFAALVLSPVKGHPLVDRYRDPRRIRAAIPQSDRLVGLPRAPFVGQLDYADIDYITRRQTLWAARNGKTLGSQYRDHADPAQVEVGGKLFTSTLDENLFEPLMPEAREEFEAGDGEELEGKMNAVHSSSAIGVNVFHDWRSRGLLSEIARACRVPSTPIAGLRFEAKYPIHDRFMKSPNLDVVIEYAPANPLKATAIECKFNEPFGGWAKRGLKSVYLDHDEFWADLPNLRKIAGRKPSADFSDLRGEWR